MPANPDRIKDLSERAVEADAFMSQAMEGLPGESTISTDQLAAHFLLMDYEARYQLFSELIITHSTQGIRLAKEVFEKATKLFQGSRP